jgi:AcrR family transcriptional regulator
MAKRTEKREATQTQAPRTGSSIRDKLVPTRERILDAAVNVLENSGLRKLAQPHIAKAAGVAQGHLTYYFPKKSDLVTALVGRFIDLLKEDLPHNLREGALERVDIMRARALRMAFRVVKNRARMRMLLGLVVTAEDDPAVRWLRASWASRQPIPMPKLSSPCFGALAYRISFSKAAGLMRRPIVCWRGLKSGLPTFRRQECLRKNQADAIYTLHRG